MPAPPTSPSSPKVRVAATGKDAERRPRVRISRRPGRRREVVMSLGPGAEPESSLPDLQPGDTLLAHAEVEVTTDCERPGDGCHRAPYDYPPEVEARLLLASDPDQDRPASGRAVAVGAPKTITCTHRHHHRVLVFIDESLEIGARTIDWPGPSHLNLVLGASHPDAGEDQFLLVGQNEPDGTVKGDMGGIRVVRLRPGSQPALPRLREDSRRVPSVPIEKGRRTILYSLELRDLKRGEQLVVKAKLATRAAGLPEAARISTRLVLADRPGDDDPGDHAKQVASFNGHVSKLNGFNCLPEERFAVSEKVGVLRIRKSARAPLFLNLVGVSAAPYGRIPPGSVLEVLERGYIEAIRYPPDREG